MVSRVNPRQLEKALLPIEITESGMVNEPVKPLQPLKAELPIEVTELDMVSVPVKPEQL